MDLRVNNNKYSNKKVFKLLLMFKNMVTQGLDRDVRSYLTRVLKTQKRPPARGLMQRISRVSPELAGLHRGISDNLDLATKLSESNPREVAKVARKHSPSYESGLAIGYLFPDKNLKGHDKGNGDFDRGLNTGQIYKMKVDGTPLRRNISRSIFTLAAGYVLYSNSGPYLFSEENMEVVKTVSDIKTIGGYASLAYAMLPMIWNNLFNNDLNPSNKLITSGQFAMHRNPFYTGVMAAGACAVAGVTATSILAANSPWIAAGVTAVGFAWMCKTFNDYAKSDERVLEKQFGEEYTEYKSRTPRFVPNPLNLFKGKKK